MCSSLREFLGRFSRSLTRWPLNTQEADPELHHSTGRDRGGLPTSIGVASWLVEEARSCKRCSYRWYAQRVPKPAKAYGAGAGWELLGQTGMAAAAGAKAGAHYSTKLERHERWKYCPQCGSEKVSTVRDRDFLPTAADVRTSESKYEALPSDQRPCPWCGEPILRVARKCRYCGEYLAAEPEDPSTSQNSSTVPVWRFGGFAWKCIEHDKMTCTPCTTRAKAPWRAGKKGDVFPTP